MEVLEEFRKPVFATINGKPIKVTNNELFAAALVKDGITKGPQAKRLRLSVIHKSEALLEQMEVAKKKVEVEEPFPKSSWTDEQERLYQELKSMAAGLPEFASCPKAEATLMILRNKSSSPASERRPARVTARQRIGRVRLKLNTCRSYRNGQVRSWSG